MKLLGKKRKLVLSLTIALFLAPSLTSAEETAESRTITIDEAVTLALENNIQLESDAIDLRIKKRTRDYAWNVFIPTAQLSGSLARTNRKEASSGGLVSTPSGLSYVSVDVPLEGKDRWTAIGGLTLGLNVNLALIEGLRATRLGYDASKISWDQARIDTEQNVRKAFFGILVQEESLKLAKGKLASSEERLKQTGINYKNGIVPELTLLQTQLAVETQKPALQESQIALEQQKKLFAFILGLPVNTAIELDGKIEPEIRAFSEDELVAEHLGDRLDIALLSKNIEFMNAQVRAMQYQIYTPSLALSQSWMPTKQPIDADKWIDSSGSFTATLAFELSGLLPFSKTGQSLAEAKDGVKKLELARQQAAYSAELEIRNLVKKLDKYSTSVTAMEMNVVIADKAYRLTEQGYRAGTIEYLDLKDAETSLLQAELGVLLEKYNYLSTLIDLEKAINAKLD